MLRDILETVRDYVS